MPRTVLLRLEAPLQSWGTQGRFSVRDTDTEPSKSGIIGLIGAAMGMRRDDRDMLARLVALEMAARIDREGDVVRDYHTVGGGSYRGQPYGIWRPNEKGDGGTLVGTALTDRFYLADASFLVALSGDDGLVERIAAALQAPVWALFLGRKACPPAQPILAGVVDGAPREVLPVQPYPGRLLRRRQHRAGMLLDANQPPAKLRMSVESADGAPRYDVPVSFERYARMHTRRFVETVWIHTPAVQEDAP